MQTEEKKEERDFRPDKARNAGSLLFDTLKKRSDFEKLRKKGRILKNKYMILYILPSIKIRTLRAGFAIGKKTGKAFQRNKIRRILKEILRKASIPISIDVFIVVRNTIAEAGYIELKRELEDSLGKFFPDK